MARCSNSKCSYDNRESAKICGQCGTPIMTGSVGYTDAGRAAAPPIPGHNILPTIPEDEAGGWDAPVQVHPGEVRMGGADPTVDEPQAQPIQQMRRPVAGMPAHTQVADEVLKPLVGWLVVLRSRSMAPYREIPLYVGRNLLGRDRARGVHYVEDTNASKEHAVVIGYPDGVDLSDLGSANGTSVNNKQVRTHTLEKGDMVKIGKTTLVYVPLPKLD